MATAEIIEGKKAASFEEPDFLYEIVNGEVTEKRSMGNSAVNYANYLANLLNKVALPQELGFAYVEALFRPRPNSNARRPDVAFVRSDVYNFFKNLDDPASIFEFAPSIAIEVISPTNTAKEIEIKVQEYFEYGVKLVWVIYPEQRRVHVFESADKSRILKEKDDLDGGKVFPEFRISVRTLFQPETVS